MENNMWIILALLLLLFGVTCFFLGFSYGRPNGYAEACKDFHSGSLRMELKEYPGGERCWVWKK